MSGLKLTNGYLYGLLHDNHTNRHRLGSGFNPLCSVLAPDRNLFRDDCVGLNFEHILNGTAADQHRSDFTPRLDRCRLVRHSQASASIIHKAVDSAWHLDSEMRYTLKGKHYVDLEFVATPREANYPLGYLVLMWASYMNRAVDRRIYFRGKVGDHEGWNSIGGVNESVQVGTVGHVNSTEPHWEAGCSALNVQQRQDVAFTYPFYYGLLEGSADAGLSPVPIVYMMMFDRSDSIRFALWNFITDTQGKPDTKSPAWDWQFIIRDPVLHRRYGYRARLLVKPFTDRKDLLREYHAWRRQPNS